MLTDRLRARVLHAQKETEALLARATRYSPEFRDAALIASYHAHLARLAGYLDGSLQFPAPPQFERPAPQIGVDAATFTP